MSNAASGNAKIKTNANKGSVCSVEVTPITFEKLWENYVTGNPQPDPTNEYKNQCAIRLSHTFHKLGIKMKSFSTRFVPPGPKKHSLGRILHDGKPVATRAYELGTWLNLVPFCGLPPKSENVTGSDWESKVKNRTGIIMFHGYWARPTEAAGQESGGHIDLWNGSRLTVSGPINAIATWGRYFGQHSMLQGTEIGYSDLRKSKLILFWPIQ